MDSNNIISVVLNCHLPFIRHADGLFYRDEIPFFQAVSNTYIPFLQMLKSLDAQCTPFRIGCVLSPTLCAMLRDETLISKYLNYTDKQIEFGKSELERTENKCNTALYSLAMHYYNSIVEKRALFVDSYGKDIIGTFDYYRKKGRLEILGTTATYNFLPFYDKHPEIIRAQIENALIEYKRIFNLSPSGFWLPECGYVKNIDKYLQKYNFNYTIIEPHTALLANPPSATGSFLPLRSPRGLTFLVRDYPARKEVEEAERFGAGFYCDCGEDICYKLDAGAVKTFLDKDGVRCPSGYRYLTYGGGGAIYNLQAAKKFAEDHGRNFLKKKSEILDKAGSITGKSSLSLCVWDADALGRFWQEGFVFLESFIRSAHETHSATFATPSEYLCRQDFVDFQTISPEFSSAGKNGYGESFLNETNDWIYRHIFHATRRMTELAQRFNDDSGLKARALKQAARETLLFQSSDFVRPAKLSKSEKTLCDMDRIVEHLRNFTTLYESLGGERLSTKLLTFWENNNNIFPDVNYKTFRKFNAL
ncbi:MAG: DUF1957 domain-containing protein [Spirochaetaceae bacterium]|jgi:1,4-alpha-glucan branching enzyme|nr:DUF1957 domain-containing protein [Spirochaetaceae bacterium]